jgi:hypothetical protein
VQDLQLFWASLVIDDGDPPGLNVSPGIEVLQGIDQTTVVGPLGTGLNDHHSAQPQSFEQGRQVFN